MGPQGHGERSEWAERAEGARGPGKGGGVKQAGMHWSPQAMRSGRSGRRGGSAMVEGWAMDHEVGPLGAGALKPWRHRATISGRSGERVMHWSLNSA